MARAWMLVLASLVVACAGPGAGIPSASVVELPLDAWRPTTLPGQSPIECVPVAIDATVHGSVADPAIVWIVDARSGQRQQVVWPDGYVARFAPAVAVIDESGRAVLYEGDRVTRACFTGLIGVYWLDPPFQQ